MEAFSLLKYWKSGAGVHGSAASKVGVPLGATPTTTIVAAVGSEEEEEDSSSDGEDGNDNDNDDGPFFDLEFAVPDNEDGEEARETVQENEIEFDEDEGEERELSCFSPSNDLFFKGRIVAAENDGGGGMKSGQFQVPASLVRSATKLRVFMLNLKRSKSESKEGNSGTLTSATNKDRNSKFFMVKLRIEDAKALLSRASSSSKLNIIRKNRCNAFIPTKKQQQKQKEVVKDKETNSENCEKEEKKIRNEAVQKYLKIVKPPYVKVSRRNTNSETAEEVGKEFTAVKSEGKVKRGGGVKMNLKVMAKKHLGKSKSGAVHSMPNHNTASSKKRDDSLLEQQDGIQSAILHCKRSFNSSSSSSDDG